MCRPRLQLATVCLGDVFGQGSRVVQTGTAAPCGLVPVLGPSPNGYTLNLNSFQMLLAGAAGWKGESQDQKADEFTAPLPSLTTPASLPA